MIFTTNVIDWQQSVLDSSHSISNDVWQQTIMMLELLRAHDVSASFFVHPNIASKYPVLIRKIQTAGHEIGCIFDTPYQKQSFKHQAQRAIEEIEDISGKKIIGTRHLHLTIQHTDFEQYCSILRTNGVQYDSSLVTQKTLEELEEDYPSLGAFKAYGISQYSPTSLSALPFADKKKLTFGGATFRLLPYEVSRILANQLDRDSTVFHIPIYDLGFNDLASIQSSCDLPWRQRLCFVGRKSIPLKLRKLFGDFPFDSFENYYFNGYE